MRSVGLYRVPVCTCIAAVELRIVVQVAVDMRYFTKNCSKYSSCDFDER